VPVTINYTAWRFWFDTGQMVATLVIGIYVWWSNRDKVAARRFAKLEAEVKDRAPGDALERAKAELEKAKAERDAKCTLHQARTAELEHNLRKIPDRAEVSELAREMNDLGQKLGRLEGRLDGLNRLGDLINEFLINQGGRGP
jgi:chromosome segregation ATPase